VVELEPQAGQAARKLGDGWEVIGPPACPILLRRTLLEGRLGKVLWHRFLPGASDKDPHDHPRSFVTVVLRGGYDDIRLDGTVDQVYAPAIRYRPATHAHITKGGAPWRHHAGDHGAAAARVGLLAHGHVVALASIRAALRPRLALRGGLMAAAGPQDLTVRELRATFHRLRAEAINIGPGETARLLGRTHDHLAFVLDALFYDTDQWDDDGGRDDG
jgi:hypothetical protein